MEHETDSKTESPICQVGYPTSTSEFIKQVEAKDFSSKLQMQFLSLWKRGKEFLFSATNSWGGIHSLIFLSAYGFFALEILSLCQPDILRRKAEQLSQYIYTQQKRWQQLLINMFVGYDTILMNALLSSPGHGYLYNYQTKEFYDLSYGQRASDGPTRFGEYLVTKCGVLIMSLFVFFTTTMSVSFTLRETQSRMLRFTVQLQHHARNHLPTFQLIFVHVIESLVFVPIMIGILFFLFEFYDDQLLAILVLTLVWLCELFTMISVRTTLSMQFFPRFFLLYFLLFHIYFFSYPYGFSYVAFSAMAAIMQHLILYFWNRFEVPALQRFMRTRAQLQQQTGVQIASSAIYTSTFHIARVSISNRNALGNEPTTAATEISAMSDQTGESNTPFANNEPPEVLNINPHQRILQRPTISLGSLLLSLLGGASSQSIFSFFSVSRDSQNQGQAHQEQTPQENQPLTT